MPKLEKSDLSQLSDSEITEKIGVIRRELFDLRFQLATRQLSETHKFKKARVQLAQLLTHKSERSRSKS